MDVITYEYVYIRRSFSQWGRVGVLCSFFVMMMKWCALDRSSIWFLLMYWFLLVILCVGF